ncbi:probable LRR receptor-like serine/threonine-protein kinase RFK1 isoform X1 [Camellia sinensis]|uniref:probable LRR receptor-like serine/threonine-protein kinase RFK1 isoform X1 n=2 Tax=Camellia sinensis TaxID=4442 RepID=UPI001035F590|nr:probable LRR receptor-like serine/threonine-protein kinase RFK1 isoform X1 [Camellia sinensis]XP_028082776.1 probable LRR receptor-like serine/threonine-protein kinase RFK1 isoform X1 [Camellia sinensis]XP_028082777.1 probable LRR receptor-like serine/threonine-protein kinase RFK1 isoform X1 [Camellia sinensis]XP_028082778.1 probable LRR receptor-like serine/threonine-protein kinase RFK1 isoform X1 [Camellia sinensis]XP_028082779.1 probable LRR receptor-like serine/threonine-protein kinase R
MDNASFVLLDKTFDEFASLWMNMKVEVKTKEDHEARQFKFKPCAFKIENIMEIGISTLGGSLENEILSDWQELLSDEKVAEKRIVDGIAHGVISLTGRISDINFKAAEFPTLSNTTGLVRLVLRNCNISGEISKYIWKMMNLQMLWIL